MGQVSEETDGARSAESSQPLETPEPSLQRRAVERGGAERHSPAPCSPKATL